MNKSKKAETRKWIKNVIERKHRYEEEQKRLFSESGAVIKDKFFNDYEKARCQSTYMSVTMLAFLENADETGLADFSKIIRYFSKFYASRRANNNIIERSDSIFAKEVPDYQKIRRLILFNPLGRSCLVKYLIYDKSSDTLSINNNLWGVLTAADIIRLKKISYEKINRYYDLLSK